METLLRDVRYAFRMLRRTPAASALAVLALALGIGANSAIFSVVYAVLLRPLPVRDAARLMVVRPYNPRFNIPPIPSGFGGYANWKKQATSFQSMAASWAGAGDLTLGRETSKAGYWRVSASFFPALGVQPALGRGFTAGEDWPGGPRVALVSDDLWRRRLAQSPTVAGQTLTLDGVPYTIVGVMPRGFSLDGKPPDVYTPIALDPAARNAWLPVTVYARLKPGIAPARAQAEMDAISKLADTRNSGWRARVSTLRDSMVQDVRLSLWVLLGAVAMVLLIACANIASLLLARSSARSREIAIRSALGASRPRLLAQFLTESMLLALAGGAAGLLLAASCVHLVPLVENARLPGLLLDTRIDGAVLAFTLAVSLATGMAFGAAPALSATPAPAQLGRTRGRNRMWSALVIAETALALVLTTGATLLIRSFFYLRDTAPGFQVDGLMTAALTPPRSIAANPEALIAFYQQALQGARATAGVTSATLASSLPLDGDYRAMSLPLEGHQYARPQDWPVLWFRHVERDYFRTLQIPLRRGRFFTEEDREGAPRVAIVNESLARRFWPAQDPIGKHVGDKGRDSYQVVGVVADVRHQDATKEGLVEMFFPYLQTPPASATLVVRAAAARAAAPLHAQPMLDMISARLAPQRLTSTVIAVFASLALLLAAIGVYGVLSFTVARQTHDIGIRMALGAQRASVVRMVVGRATALAGAGAAIGLAGAFAFARVLSSMLYGVSATDPLVFAAATASLLAVALAAAWLPARRAAAVDPVLALREE
jgi:putative ABC transport system permease protein